LLSVACEEHLTSHHLPRKIFGVHGVKKESPYLFFFRANNIFIWPIDLNRERQGVQKKMPLKSVVRHGRHFNCYKPGNHAGIRLPLSLIHYQYPINESVHAFGHAGLCEMLGYASGR
jgi:hypothetical protein